VRYFGWLYPSAKARRLKVATLLAVVIVVRAKAAGRQRARLSCRHSGEFALVKTGHLARGAANVRAKAERMKTEKKEAQGAERGLGRVSARRSTGGSPAGARQHARADRKTPIRPPAQRDRITRASCCAVGPPRKDASRATRRAHPANPTRLRRNRAEASTRCDLPPSVVGLFNKGRAPTARHPTLRVTPLVHFAFLANFESR